ncbi:hypothetical protein D1BOALGB6SA_9407 [Olavius sp. associated proteobacterium Delta 1]|nr:hypothetical protein D1BOALGB6SA_9407 [Olavius sp. associated proteobacterium Delta 1]
MDGPCAEVSLFADAAEGPEFEDAPFKIYSTEKMVSQWGVRETLGVQATW